MSCSSKCPTGVCVLQEGISYRMICITGGHLLYKQMDMYFWNTW